MWGFEWLLYPGGEFYFICCLVTKSSNLIIIINCFQGDCTVDKEFVPDESGHCDGLRKAFTPRAFFVCCRLLVGGGGEFFIGREIGREFGNV